MPATATPTTPPQEVSARPVGEPSPVAAKVRHRLVPPMPDDQLWSWVWTLAITLVAGILRFVNLGHPPDRIFDEVYYSKDAWSLLHHGYELNAAGDGPAFVAHPPLGKWIIALGQAMFGNDSFGWRFSAAVTGTLCVLLLIRLARRMFRSTLLGCLAGLLFTLDGLMLVLSRTALLDIFLMAFVLAAFACLVMDREARRRQVLRAMENGATTARGILDRGSWRSLAAWRAFPWWRLAAGVTVGCALGVKWSAVWYVITFAVLIYAWEVGTQRTAGILRPLVGAFRELGWIAAYVAVALLTYLATWTGWIVTDDGWDRHWAANTGKGIAFVPDWLVNLAHYHQAVLDFHTNLSTTHTYQSSPWSWLFLGRPVAFAYTDPGGCGAATCSSETLALGTPALWWVFIPALIAVTWLWLARRDWRAGAILACVAAGLLPWLAFPARTMFFFYTLPALPFLVLAVTMVLGVILGPREASLERRSAGALLVAGYVVIVALTFAYFYPVFVSGLLTHSQWNSRMLLESWI